MATLGCDREFEGVGSGGHPEAGNGLAQPEALVDRFERQQ